VIHLDTHILSPILENLTEFFSENAYSLLESEELWISPMVLLELQYLKEIKRINLSSDQIFRELNLKFDLKLLTDPFDKVIQCAVDEDWTRDPFNRIIITHARLHSAKLLTKDSIIRKHYSRAI
jgi:PIN domain nuclease of toxin-antitoxin system